MGAMHNKNNLQLQAVGFPDYGTAFYHDQPFPSREDLVTFVKMVGVQQGFVLKITRSDLSRKTKRVEFGCERGGVYKSKGSNITTSKKSGCPFSIKAKASSNGDQNWTLEVMCGIHNHLPFDSLLDKSVPETLRNENIEKEFDESLCEQHREPSQPPRAPQSSHKNQKSATTSSNQGGSGSNSQCVSQRRTRSSTGFVPHEELKHYIEEVHEVVGDGNCGFRAISMHLHGREDNHHRIRMDLINEMKDHRQLYISLLGGITDYNVIMNGLNVSSECDVGKDKWLRFPSMGCIIASKYNVVMVSVPTVTTGECITFLPYHSSPPPNIGVWAIGLNANKDHFVQVKLRNGSPLPPVYPLWQRHSTPVARPWKAVISHRLNLYTPLLPIAKTEGQIIVLD